MADPTLAFTFSRLRMVVVVLGVLAAIAVAIMTSPAAHAGWSPTVDTSGSALAGRSQFDAVTAANGVTTAVWIAGGKLMFARSNGSSWSAAAEVDASAAPSGIPIVGLMPNGDVLAFWVQCPGGTDNACSAYTSEYTVASSTWSGPVQVSSAVVGEGYDLSVGPTGVATLGWVGWVTPSDRNVRVATGQPNGSDVWVWTVRGSAYETGFERSIQIVSDSTGGAMVAWHTDGSAPMDYVRRAGAVWDATAGKISPPHPGWGEGWSPSVRLAIDASDVVTAIWNEIGTNWATPNVQAHITRVARFDPISATWGSPVTLTPAGHEGFEGDVATAADGTTTAVWMGNSTLRHTKSAVYASTYNAGTATWASPYVLADGIEPGIARVVGTDQGALAVWDNAGTTTANLLRSGAWQYAVTLPGGTNPVATMGGASFADGWPSGARVLTASGDPRVVMTSYSPISAGIGAPVDPVVATDYAGLAVSWQAPVDSGVWGVQSYTATAAPGGQSCTTSARSCAIPGLVNGTAYAVTVTASAPDGSRSAAPVSGTPRARDGWVGALTATTVGTGPRWDGTFGTAAIAHDPRSGRALAVTYISDGSGPGYVTTILNGDGSASGIADGRISVDGPSAYWSGSPAVQADPTTGGWLVFYYAGPAGADNGSTCGNSDGSETAGAVRVARVAADGTIAAAPDAVDGICAAGTLSAQWDPVNERFLVAGAISTASDGRKLRGRLVGADGTPIGTVLPLASFASDPQSDLAYASVSRRYLAVAYAGGVARAVLLADDGTAVAGVSPRTFANTSGLRPSVAYDAAADQFVVVWGSGEVVAQRVSAATGALVGSPITVASQAWTGRPRAIGNPVTGEVLVAWTGTTAADSNNMIMARTIPSGANPLGSGPVLISGTTRTANRPALAFDAASCAYRLAFTAKPTANESVRLYTRGFQPDWCSRSQLTVSRGGSGEGSVAASAGGIDCGATCTATYARTTETASSVTLTAAAVTGSTFAGWSGACSGSAATCVVTMDAARSVEATFAAGTSPTPSPTPAEAAVPASAAPAGTPMSPAAGSPSNRFRMQGGGPRQVGLTVISTIRVPGSGTLRQIGRVGGARRSSVACTAQLTVRRAGAVVMRCTLSEAALRAATRAARSTAIALQLETTFAPTGGRPRTTSTRVDVRTSAPVPSSVTG